MLHEGHVRDGAEGTAMGPNPTTARQFADSFEACAGAHPVAPSQLLPATLLWRFCHTSERPQAMSFLGSTHRYQEQIWHCSVCNHPINDGSERLWTPNPEAPRGEYRCMRCAEGQLPGLLQA